MNQKPSLNDIVWAELLFFPNLKRLSRNAAVLDGLLQNGWIRHTSRKSEFTLTDLGRTVAEKRVSVAWPTWREDLTRFAEAKFCPEDPAHWRLIQRRDTPRAIRKLERMNRRTRNAWLRLHSKVEATVLPVEFSEIEFTTDEVTRLVLPPKSSIKQRNGTMLDCDIITAIFGEVVIPERAWCGIEAIIAPEATIIVSIENKGAFIDFPKNPKAILVHLPGDDISALGKLIQLIGKIPVYHFGDLDPDGIDIFIRLNTSHGVKHFIPKYADEYITTHALVPNRPWPSDDYTSLHPIVSRLVTMATSLEQEAMVLDLRFEQEIATMISVS